MMNFIQYLDSAGESMLEELEISHQKIDESYTASNNFDIRMNAFAHVLKKAISERVANAISQTPLRVRALFFIALCVNVHVQKGQLLKRARRLTKLS